MTARSAMRRLWGWIDAEVQRRAARAAVESTPGVEFLEDNLMVAPPRLQAGGGTV